MNRFDTGEVKCPMPTVTVEPNRINRGLQLLSGLASVITTFCIGLVSGAAGGLLLGASAVVVLQSLELLDENKPLMEKLENYQRVKGSIVAAAPKQNISQITCNNHELNLGISILSEEFGVVSSTLSLAVGLSTGLSAYSVVIKKYSEAAMGKALGLSGLVCLLGVTAPGYALGLTLERFLSFIISFDFSVLLPASLYLIGLSFASLLLLNFLYHFCEFSSSFLFPFIVFILKPGAAYTIILITLFLKTKLVLVIALIPTVWGLYRLENIYDFQLTTAPVALVLIITEVFNIANQPIVTLHSETVSSSSAVHEGLFVGLLTSQLFTAAVGLSLFVSWQRGGTAKICASAAGSGAAVLGVIKLALPVLGPGPTIGALVGVAGAVGVSLSAAGAATDYYGQEAGHYGLVGRLGVTVGAAAGAFLSSCGHSGLSGIFMGLCAAAIPAGLYLKLMFLFVYRTCVWLNIKFFLYIIIFTTLLIWFYFACTDKPDEYWSVPLALFPFLYWTTLLMHTLSMDR